MRRLREPRYLVGALVGGAYIYFSFFARFRGSGDALHRRGRAASPPDLSALAAAGPGLSGVLMLVLAALGWLVPFDSGLLTFSRAEMQFLFPAPVSRRSLLVYRMLRSQIGMLFGSVIVAIASPGTGYTRLRVAVAMWLLMCTWKLYFTGVSLARARLRAADAGSRRIARVPLLLLTAAVVIVGAAVWRTVGDSPMSGFRDALNRLVTVATTGLSSIVLSPFVAVARPLFAPWAAPYIASLVGSAAVLAAIAIWLVLTDSSTFQDAVEEVAKRREREAQAAPSLSRTRTAAWQLAPTGSAEGIFAWKAAVQTVRLVDRGHAARMASAFIAFAIASAAIGRRGGWTDAFAAFTLLAAAFSVVLGPQAVRLDMRQDLQHLEILKTWPVHPAAVLRGELLWPGVLLTGFSWVLLVLAVLVPFAPLGGISAEARVSAGLAAIVVTPALVFGQLVVQNALAVMFPAWVPLGAQRARGLDAMGQRIILLGGTWLVMALMLIPGVIPAAIVWYTLRGLIGGAAVIPAASIVTGVVLAEVFAATELLGPVYDRLDVLAVERAEE
jgi:Putative ABC exporter